MQTKAYFELSEQKVLTQYNKLVPLADKISYSFKTNREVGKILEEKTDCEFSVHTIKSLQEVKERKNIWFFLQGAHEKEIKEILKENIENFVIDNEQDLSRLLETITKEQIKINILLRMRLKENTIHTGKHYVYGLYSTKVKELLPKLKQHTQIKKLGIHFHRKTQNVSEWSIKEELEEIFTKEELHQMDILNMGGGLPIVYKNYSVDVSKGIFGKIQNLKEWLKEYGIQFIIEPGRFIAGPAVDLIAHIKIIYENNIIIDCSVYNAAMSVFDSNIRFEIEGEQTKGVPYTIKGCTPDSTDIFRYRVFLKDPKIGDVIKFKNVGAYNYATDFCNIDPLKTIIIK